MRSISWRQFGVALSASCLFLSAAAWAGEVKDCTGGRPDASQCLKQLKAAEAELQRKNQQLKQKFSPKPSAALSAALHRSHRSWLAYRDAQCGLEHLLDGTTDAYRPAMVASCKLYMTEERIKDVQRQREL